MSVSRERKGSRRWGITLPEDGPRVDHHANVAIIDHDVVGRLAGVVSGGGDRIVIGTPCGHEQNQQQSGDGQEQGIVRILG